MRHVYKNVRPERDGHLIFGCFEVTEMLLITTATIKTIGAAKVVEPTNKKLFSASRTVGAYELSSGRTSYVQPYESHESDNQHA